MRERSITHTTGGRRTSHYLEPSSRLQSTQNENKRGTFQSLPHIRVQQRTLETVDSEGFRALCTKHAAGSSSNTTPAIAIRIFVIFVGSVVRGPIWSEFHRFKVSIGRLLFNRPVDRSRSISTVDKDLPTWKYGPYLMDRRFHPKIGRNRPSMWFHTKKK